MRKTGRLPVVFCWGLLGALMGMVVPVFSSGKEVGSSAIQLFEETIITEQIEQVPNLDGLSQSEVLLLESAKKILTEYFRRLHPGYGPPASSVMSEELKLTYNSDTKIFVDYFNTEAIVSYRIFHYQLRNSNTEVMFRFFLTETSEGVDYITQREVGLKLNAAGDWKIFEFR